MSHLLEKKFSAFYGKRRFITVLTAARYLVLSSVRLIQSTTSLLVSSRATLIISSYLNLGFPLQILCSVLATQPYVLFDILILRVGKRAISAFCIRECLNDVPSHCDVECQYHTKEMS